MDSSNKKTIINLSRNTPVALVVGAASFLGSHLIDQLLNKNIQVIGVDNFATGKKENLSLATKSSYFHLVNQDAEDLEIDPERLDYIFVLAGKLNIKNILRIFKEKGARLLFRSFIEIYSDEDLSEELKWYKKTELELAKFAKEHDLNARVLRLGSVFGPRMNFDQKDPTVKLIQESLTSDLQKEVPMEFSSRALYVSDAVELMIKCVLAGSTAQRIFDGVHPNPVKVSEIKQILMDPIWYEEKGFTPSELPPWSTPNLEKTMKFLNWKPKANLVASLKQTIGYFKDNEIRIPKVEYKEADKEELKWEKAKKAELEKFKEDEGKSVSVEPIEVKKEKKSRGWLKISLPLGKIYLILVILIVVYAFVWPIFAIGFGVLTFKYQISQALDNLQKGEFDKGLNNVSAAQVGLEETEKIFTSLEIIRKTNLFTNFLQAGDSLTNLATLSSDSAKNIILGMQELYQGLRAVTGENKDSPKEFFSLSQALLARADQDLSEAKALLTLKDLSSMPLLGGSIESLSKKLTVYLDLVKKGRAISAILPEVVAIDGAKTYLVLLQNNMELRPTGGFIGSFAKVSFEGGKLKKLEVNDIYAIDGQLKINVEPPVELKTDLGQKNWFLRDSNWEADFPTSARQAEWFYTKETTERVDGVFALDISATQELLAVLGGVDLSDYNEKISSDNLFEKAVTHAEMSFFPGSSAKKSFLTALTQEVFNKLFFVPHQNWPGIVSALGKSLDQKHISIYLNDPKLFAYLNSQNWTNALPRQSSLQTDSFEDFIALVEANLGANKSNYYLDRNYNLETVIGKDGEVSHKLRISYTNRSPSDTFPAGKYKNRLRIYLPFGAKLTKGLWGEKDLSHEVKSFVDYGRSGYSMLLELAPKEQKTLVLDFQIPGKLEFKAGKAKYKLNILKQAGTLKDPFLWRISYPINYSLASEQTKKLGPQEQTIQTDLSVDRSFMLEFKR